MKKLFYRAGALLLCLALLITPSLAITTEDMAQAVQEVAEQAIAECVDDSMTDLEKLTALHDWMCLHCEYGQSPNASYAYGGLVEGVGNCMGYARGYAALAAAAGLEGVATYSYGMEHGWILATLDGTRYFSDCTWDDGKKAKLGLIRHLYWLFDQSNAGDTNHYGWLSEENVPGGILETAPWSAAMTRVIFSGDYCWYIDADMCLWRCDRDTWHTELLLDMSDIEWPYISEEGGTPSGIYSGLILLDDRLIFNTPYEILSVDLEGGDGQVLLAPDTGDGVIYGIAVRDGTICYSVATGPDDTLYEIVDTGLSAVGAWGYGWEDDISAPSDTGAGT